MRFKVDYQTQKTGAGLCILKPDWLGTPIANASHARTKMPPEHEMVGTLFYSFISRKGRGVRQAVRRTSLPCSRFSGKARFGRYMASTWQGKRSR